MKRGMICASVAREGMKCFMTQTRFLFSQTFYEDPKCYQHRETVIKVSQKPPMALPLPINSSIGQFK